MWRRTVGRIYSISAATLWGTSFVVIRWGLQYVPAMQFVALRFFFAFLMAFIYTIYVGELKEFFSLFLTPYILFTSILNAGGYIFQFLGQQFTSATNASILINTSAIFAAILAHFYLNERINRVRALTISAALFGVFLLITGGRLESIFTKYFLGDLLCLVAGAIWGAYIVASKKVDVRGNEAPLLATWFLYTSVISSPLALIQGISPLKLNAVLAIIYLSLFCSFIAFFLWFKGLKILEATTSSIYFLLEVVISAFLEEIVFGLEFGLIELIGALLTIVGVVLTDLSFLIEKS